MSTSAKSAAPPRTLALGLGGGVGVKRERHGPRDQAARSAEARRREVAQDEVEAVDHDTWMARKTAAKCTLPPPHDGARSRWPTCASRSVSSKSSPSKGKPHELYAPRAVVSWGSARRGGGRWCARGPRFIWFCGRPPAAARVRADGRRGGPTDDGGVLSCRRLVVVVLRP